jgi:hypothetical protein
MSLLINLKKVSHAIKFTSSWFVFINFFCVSERGRGKIYETYKTTQLVICSFSRKHEKKSYEHHHVFTGSRTTADIKYIIRRWLPFKANILALFSPSLTFYCSLRNKQHNATLFIPHLSLFTVLTYTNNTTQPFLFTGFSDFTVASHDMGSNGSKHLSSRVSACRTHIRGWPGLSYLHVHVHIITNLQWHLSLSST